MWSPKPASSQVRHARAKGLENTLPKGKEPKSGAKALAAASPAGVRGISVGAGVQAREAPGRFAMATSTTSEALRVGEGTAEEPRSLSQSGDWVGYKTLAARLRLLKDC